MENLFKKTILIVDDTPENLDVLNGLLSDFNRKVAISGEKALQLAFSDPSPDLILLDIMMPGMDGYEVCRQLRENEKTQDIPVIFLTAKSTREDIVKGFEVGGQDYVTKPFGHHELLQRVKTHLELKSQRETLKKMNEVLDQKVKERTLELEEANRKLSEALEQLKGLDDAKSNFLKIISHEVRTPINGIMGSTYFLEEIIEDEEMADFIDMLKISIERLNRLSNMALEITEMQTLTELHSTETINLAEIMADAIEREENSDYTFNTTLEDALFYGEHDRILKALGEIVNNSVKFSKGQTIDVSTGVDENYSWVCITNTSDDIDEQKIKELFKPFGLPGDHSDNNTGLGLAYVNAVTALHNGKVEIKNKNGKTSVWLKFLKL
jgi:two-component system sensor histidine kinase/response regulator